MVIKASMLIKVLTRCAGERPMHFGAVLLLFGFLSCLWQCSGAGTVEIKGITFGRECVAVELGRGAAVRRITLDRGGKRLAEVMPEEETDLYVVEGAWRPGDEVRVDVAFRDGGPPSSIVRRAPDKPSPILLAGFDMEQDVEPRDYRSPGYLGGQVAISPDGAYAAVGTEKSYLRVYDVAGRRRMWSKRIGEGRILAMTFACRGRYLLVGEQSRDARLYCYDVSTGKELWRYRAADESAPSSAVCYAAATRQYSESGSQRYVGVVYAFDVATGGRLWRYPAQGSLDAGLSMVVTDSQGQYVLFNNYRKAPVCDKALYCLDGRTGELLWNWELELLSEDSRYSNRYLKS